MAVPGSRSSLVTTVTLLGSATPSVESYFNAATGKYGLVTLAERYGGAVLPRVIVSDTLRAAKRGKMVYAKSAVYKFYHVLSKVLPHGLLMEFTEV